MDKFLVILRSYNDIDHISPVIWKLLNENAKVDTIINSTYDYKNDLRLNFLKKNKNFNIIYNPDLTHEKFQINLGSEKKINFINSLVKKIYYKILDKNNFIGKFFHKFFFNCIDEYFFLKKNKYNCILVEWGAPAQRGLKYLKYITAAKGIGIPIICLPHGLNIYLNSDIHKNYKNIIKKGIIPDKSDFNFYDFLFVQSKFHAKHFHSFGVKKDKIIIAGSPRFCPEWIQNLDKIYEDFVPSNQFKNKTKIVFMLPHWIYNVDKEATLDLINKISNMENIYLIIKNHTRADTGLFPKNIKVNSNVEVNSNTNSTSLINWADIIINFGSSIGIEAIIKKKILICPNYLHENNVIFEKSKATYNTFDQRETLSIIQNHKNMSKDEIENDFIMKNIVYASSDELNVLDSYFNKIKKIINLE